MMEGIKQLFLENVVVSLKAAVVVVLLFCFTAKVKKRYQAGWRYYSWLVIMLLFLFPFRAIGLDYQIDVTQGIEAFREHTDAVQRWIFQNMPANEEPVPATEYAADKQDEAASVRSDVVLALSVLWLGIALSYFLLHIWRYAVFKKAVRRCSNSVREQRVLACLAAEKQKLNISADLPVRVTALTETPMLLGLYRPILLLPTQEYTARELELIFRHELFHYKRGDIWYQFLTLIFLSLHWFNPIIHLMADAIALDGETACDEKVLQGRDYETRVFYGEMLLKFIKGTKIKRSYLSTTFFGGKRGMKKRLEFIAKDKKKKRGMAAMAVLIAGTTMMTTCVAATSVWDERMLAYFQPTEAQVESLGNSVSRPQATAVSNGITVNVLQTISEKHGIYVLYEMITPDDIQLTDDVQWEMDSLEVHSAVAENMMGINGESNKVLERSEHKMTVLKRYDVNGTMYTQQKMALRLSNLVRYVVTETDIQKEVVAPCEFTLHWNNTYVNTTKVFEVNKRVNITGSNQNVLTQIEVSPMSIWMFIEGDDVLTVVKPVIKMKDGSEIQLEMVNDFHTSFNFTAFSDKAGGRMNIGYNFEHITDLSEIESVTVGDVCVPIGE